MFKLSGIWSRATSITIHAGNCCCRHRPMHLALLDEHTTASVHTGGHQDQASSRSTLWQPPIAFDLTDGIRRNTLPLYTINLTVAAFVDYVHPLSYRLSVYCNPTSTFCYWPSKYLQQQSKPYGTLHEVCLRSFALSFLSLSSTRFKVEGMPWAVGVLLTNSSLPAVDVLPPQQ